MSQNLGNHKEVLENLITYSKAILKGDPGLDLYTQYKEIIPLVTPTDVISIVDVLVKTNSDTDQVKGAVNKLLNIFYEPIKNHGKVNAAEGTFLFYLMEENRFMEMKLKNLKEYTKKVFGQKDKNAALLLHREAMLAILLSLKEYEKHFLKIENILFPYFEKAVEDFRCVSIMWSMHDDARKSLGQLIQVLESENSSVNKFNFEIGRFYFSVLPVIFREEYILFPECHKQLEKESWDQMLEQSRETGFAFFEIPPQTSRVNQSKPSPSGVSISDLETESLEVEQIKNLLNHLPVDITYVDAQDEVRYFNDPKERFFARSKAIIGRKVQNCHPPESIETVNRILESFRSGEKDKAVFWIQTKGRFILIQYFAVRDHLQRYQGVLEVSQDVTGIRQLEGERRLLDW